MKRISNLWMAVSLSKLFILISQCIKDKGEIYLLTLGYHAYSSFNTAINFNVVYKISNYFEWFQSGTREK